MAKKRIRVLTVEDYEATRYVIKTAFADRGEKVDWDLCFAKHGEEALDCLFRRGDHGEAALPDFGLAGLEPSQGQWQRSAPATQERRELKDTSSAGFFAITNR